MYIATIVFPTVQLQHLANLSINNLKNISLHYNLGRNIWLKTSIIDIYVYLLPECSSGTYGKNCTKTCSGNCLHNEPCDHIDGACTDGCEDGYIGNICNICKTFVNYLFIDFYH